MAIQKLKALPLSEIDSVLLRLDLNVPIKNGVITDDTRIVKALPTLRYILERTGKLCILSHLGRPKGKYVEDMSLSPVGEYLAEKLGYEVLLVRDYDKEPVDQLMKQLGKKQFLLLENLRFHSEETDNDQAFAENLAKGFKYFINDAFGAVHRSHASITALPSLFPKDRVGMGLLLGEELEALSRLKKNSQPPYTIVLGGAKVSDKMGVILNLLQVANNLVIGGAMAYTFLKYKGFDVGNSKYEADKMEVVKSIFEAAQKRNVEIHLPVDHIAAAEFSEQAKPIQVHEASIPEGLIGLDIGPRTVERFSEVLARSKTIFWNGPLGLFEWNNFTQGTLQIARKIADSGAFTVVGGGDSLAALKKAGVMDKIGHVSTGGGASLEYLEGLILPGLKALGGE